MNFTLPIFIEILGGAQGLLLLLVWLRSPARHGWAGRFLAVLLGTASALLFWMALHDTRWLAYVPDLIGLGAALPLLLGPLLYGYLYATVRPAFRWRAGYGLHSLPFWLVLLGHISFYARPYAEKRAFVLHHFTQPHLDWWGQFPMIHFLVYALLAYPLIDRHHTALKSRYSAIEAFRLTWLRQLMVGLGVCYGLFGLVYVVRGLHPAGSALAFTLGGFVYLVGYRQLRQPTLFEAHDLTDSDPAPDVVTDSRPPELLSRKYEKSELPPDKGQQYAGQLNQWMSDQKRYRDGQLSLRQVADALAISPHVLSQVINQTLGVSFYDYVNGYRVEAVKRALVDPRKRHLTILALAFEAGFESKATFNNAFKKQTGLTPSQYRRQQRSA